VIGGAKVGIVTAIKIFLRVKEALLRKKVERRKVER